MMNRLNFFHWCHKNIGTMEKDNCIEQCDMVIKRTVEQQT